MRALGIDVSKSRGLDLVLMGGSGELIETRRRFRPADLPSFVEETEPEVVAIDSPPAWGTLGASRLTERELRRFGIQSYGTPSDPARADNAFYDWMRVGMESFAQISDRFPRYRSGPVRGSAIEAFPHASAVVLADCLPPTNVKKHVWRRSILRAHKIDEDELRSADQVDAALAAYTGLLALRGKFTALGDPREGVIVLPARTLPAAPFRRCIQPPEQDPQLHLPGLAPCGCGDPDCAKLTRAEFARGHEAKRKSALWRKARHGEEAAQELQRRGWELPPELRS